MLPSSAPPARSVQEFLTVLADATSRSRTSSSSPPPASPARRSSSRARTYTVEELTNDSFKDVQIAFFSAGGSISKEFAPAAVAAGAVVVDNTSAFRMKDGIPLVVPEVNPEQIHKHNGLIANPNCSTIIMNVPVWPLHKVNRVKRIIVSTYQAVSGAGAWGLYELDAQIKAYAAGQPIEKEKFPHQIVNNLFCHNPKVAEQRLQRGREQDGERDAQDLRRPEDHGHRHLRPRPGPARPQREHQPRVRAPDDPGSRCARSSPRPPA